MSAGVLLLTVVEKVSELLLTLVAVERAMLDVGATAGIGVKTVVPLVEVYEVGIVVDVGTVLRFDDVSGLVILISPLLVVDEPLPYCLVTAEAVLNAELLRLVLGGFECVLAMGAVTDSVAVAELTLLALLVMAGYEVLPVTGVELRLVETSEL